VGVANVWVKKLNKNFNLHNVKLVSESVWQVSWLQKVRRTFTGLLNEMEKDSSLNVNQSCKNYNIANCLINLKEPVEEVKEATINACWRQLWPEVVNDRRLCNMNDVVAEAVTTAPYKEIHKELERKRKQTSIKSYFVCSNSRH
jgi:hypothetical protein